MKAPRALPALLLALGAAVAAAQQGGVPAANPYTGASDVAAGAEIFRAHCAACHGLDGSGSAAAPDLTTGSFRHGSTDADVFRVMRVGIPGTSMTPADLDGPQIWQVIAYVRSLALRRAAQAAGGDAVEGERVFRRAGCVRCHTLAGEGGDLGPDLTHAGARRTPAALRRAILDPDDEVAPEHWRVRARTRGGEVVTGTRLNEDTHSYQIRDARGRLRSLDKRELAEHETLRTSAMPSFRGKLGERELEDLVAFLAARRPAGAAGGSK